MPATGIGARLRDARMQRGLSLRGVANALGVSASLVSQVETGKTQPSVSTLYAIANHLGVSLDELLGIVPTSARPAPTMFGHSVESADVIQSTAFLRTTPSATAWTFGAALSGMTLQKYPIERGVGAAQPSAGSSCDMSE